MQDKKLLLILAGSDAAKKDPTTVFLAQTLQDILSSYRHDAYRVAVSSLDHPSSWHRYMSGGAVKALFLPGARNSQDYRNKLNTADHNRLRAYVEQGGLLVGICAGAYFLTNSIYYLNAEGDEPAGSHDNLSLLPYISMGDIRRLLAPAKSGYHQGWKKAAPVTLKFSELAQMPLQNGRLSCFYMAGPMFQPLRTATQPQALAYYKHTLLRDDPLAIVRNALGQGQVLAIGPHIEVMSHQLRNEALLHGHDHDGGRYRRALAHKLAADDDPRLRCFHHLLQKAFI
jgi:glutamine amidotransferase-like uncharacterized protein